MDNRGATVTPREERLLRIEERSERRVKRRRVMARIAYGFGNDAKAQRYVELASEAERTQRVSWQARVAAGTRRWAADDARQRLVLVER